MNIDNKQYGHFKISAKGATVSTLNLKTNTAHSHSQFATALSSGLTLSDKNQ